MMTAEEIQDLERAALVLRSAVASALSQGMDEDWVYSLVEAGVNDASAWAMTARMQAKNGGQVRPDGVDRYAYQTP